MEPVAVHARARNRAGQRERLRDGRLVAMKGGVEAGDTCSTQGASEATARMAASWCG